MEKSTFERIEMGTRTNLVLTALLATLVSSVVIWVCVGFPM